MKHSKIISEGRSSKGYHAWWAQRVTAVALVPLIIYFIFQILNLVSHASRVEVLKTIGSPLNTVMAIILFAVALYHGMLGVIEIIEDYVHCKCARISLIIGTKFVTYLTMVALICAILSFHISVFGEKISEVLKLVN